MIPSLVTVLWVKVCITCALWALPMLLAPSNWLVGLGFPLGDSVVFVRLLGVAYLSLAIGYCTALRQARSQFPTAIVLVGVVSNVGASIALLANRQEWSGWTSVAPVFMQLSAGATATIGAALMYWLARRLAGPLHRC